MDLLKVTQTTLYFFTKRILSIFITVLIISSCASPKKINKQTYTPPDMVEELETESIILASDYLAEAENASTEDSIALMLKAANAYNVEKNHIKSLWLANQVSKLTLSNAQSFETLLIKTQSLFDLEQFEAAEEQIALASKMLQNELVSSSYQYHHLISLIEKNKNNTIRSNYAALLAFNIKLDRNDTDVMSLWDGLSRLSTWELRELKGMNPPYFDGWYNLILKTNKWGDNKIALDQTIIEFQSQYFNHPANFIAEQLLLVSQIEAPLTKNIAVLLPLSGKRKSIGEIVQQGMLANYSDNETSLHFIDTTDLDFTTLTTLFDDKDIDHVIGPLLKPNVDQYIAQIDIELPTLLLNIPTVGKLATNHFAFSMKREDEAIQAATVLANKSYKHPVLFSTQDRLSRKIAAAFANKWQLLTGTVLETVTLEANEKMQKSLKTSLDIDVSRSRIKNLERQINQKIKTEYRNRRDIDMVFIAAPSKFTRLIKPFIDVNTSTYSTTIPMFASSLSHKGSSNNAEIRDLTGLTFSEIPWLLDSEMQNKKASEISHKLWPSRADSFQRIYALGYDSLSIISKLSQMQEQQYLRHYGQTGELKIERNNIISRSILWGKYTDGTVKEVTMD